MTPETILEKVCRSLDILVALGAPYEGLFPSIIDRSTHQMMTKMPPGIAGQRDGDLPRGASGIDWYESQMGPSFLQHGLARIALMACDGLPCILEGDYTAR